MALPIHFRSPARSHRGMSSCPTPLAVCRAGMLLAACLLSGACASKDYVQIYRTEPHAPSYANSEIEALDHLGATIVDQGVNFSVYSKNATRLELLLFDDPRRRF